MSRFYKCNKGTKVDWSEFLRRSVEVHGDKYDYSLAREQYINLETPVELICRTCGSHFWIIPYRHCLRNVGCPYCNRRINNTEEFIQAAKEVHGDLYSYEKTVFVKMQGIITVTCSKCGDFEIRAVDHLRGSGCSCCAHSSTFETFTEQALNILNISSVKYKKFDDLRGKNNTKLSFDFYCEDLNLLIEAQGAQHYRPVRFNNCSQEEAEQNFKEQQIRDQRKRDYCKEKGYLLMEIPYSYNTVSKIKEFIVDFLIFHNLYSSYSVPSS